MLCVVASHDDELTFAIEIENVDHVQPPRALFGARRTDSAPEEQTDDVEDEERGDEERHDCPKYWEQL